MYTGPIIDTHMHFWDLANAYPWLNNRDPAIERLIGKYELLSQVGYAARTFNFELNFLAIAKVRIAHPTWLILRFLSLLGRRSFH